MSKLTPLQIKALKQAQDALGKTNKHELQNVILDVLRPLLGPTTDLYQKALVGVQAKVAEHEDGKLDAAAWIQAVLESDKTA